ncbi:carboxymuconolactone decarboxylase family protein [Synergistaceae bacterium OttesenSCG-928-I11]|nr:carboxymuconolactone decarboxylase family protein [Synergistaceae bacterium OttesenSCG-928-I11]
MDKLNFVLSLKENILLFAALAAIFSVLLFPGVSGASDAEILTPRREKIGTIASFTAKGDIPRLKKELHAGLEAGLSINEIKEVLMQMYAYCGFPRSLNGIAAFMEVVDERKAKGIKDEEGRAPTPFPQKSKYEIGAEIQTTLAGAPIPTGTGLYAFTPPMDAFLKEHLFCDLVARDNLNLIDREIATVAALASMKGTEGQLAFHKGALVRVGLPEPEVEKLLNVVTGTTSEKSQAITRAGSQPSAKGPADFFTGNVRIDPLFDKTDEMNASAAYVTFEPGARSNWHTHPCGQQLIVVSGVGLTGVWDGPVTEIKAGDVVTCPVGVKHWHGASPTTAMTHIAVTGYLDENAVEWMEPVTDEQYNRK